MTNFTKKCKNMRNGASARWKTSGPRVEKIQKGSGELFRAYGVGIIWATNCVSIFELIFALIVKRILTHVGTSFAPFFITFTSPFSNIDLAWICLRTSLEFWYPWTLWIELSPRRGAYLRETVLSPKPSKKNVNSASMFLYFRTILASIFHKKSLKKQCENRT